LVEWDSKKVKILNWEAVADIGDFSDEYLRLGKPADSEPSIGAKLTENA
jgi:hypothetical protein